MPSRSLPELTRRLDAHRDRRGLADIEVIRLLAKKGVHVEPPLYSRYRSGERLMPPSVLGTLCDLFAIPDGERLRLFELLTQQDVFRRLVRRQRANNREEPDEVVVT